MRRAEVRGQKTMQIRLAKDLKVYQKAYDLAMQIFEVTKSFTKEETYEISHRGIDSDF